MPTLRGDVQNGGAAGCRVGDMKDFKRLSCVVAACTEFFPKFHFTEKLWVLLILRGHLATLVSV